MNSIEQQFNELLPASIKKKEISINGITYYFKSIEGMKKAMQATIEFKALNKLAQFVLLHKKYSQL